MRYVERMKAKAMLSGIVAAGLLIGCSTTGRKVDQTQVDTIRVGDDKASVEARIGAPDQISKSVNGGENWIYAYSRSRPNAKRFIPLFGTFIGGKNVESQTVTVVFNDDGRVADVTTAYSAKDAQGRPTTTTTGTATSTTTTTTTTTPSP
jgi:outer membrane protein assembly factor BamE (lipoprotein component of BamABCDE complex)